MTWLSRNLAKLGVNDWFISEWVLDGHAHGTPADTLTNAGGKVAQKEIQCTGNGATTENLFLVSSPVKLFGVYGIVSAVGDDTTFDSLKLELDDGTVQADITLASNDLTGNATVGTLIIKDAEDSVKMDVLQANQVRYHEGPNAKLFSEGVITPKNGTATYIRVSYTGDINTDITFDWHIRYIPLYNESSVIAAISPV